MENSDGGTGGDMLDPSPVQELGHWAGLCASEFSSDVAQNLKTDKKISRVGSWQAVIQRQASDKL